jgi:pyruvate formate lyase activating enzyme
MTAAALDQLAEAGLDAMNVDIKGDAAAVRRYGRGVDAERIWERCRQARELGLHLEITLLVIPDVNDDDSSLAGIARRIVDELGPHTPWHVSGYWPAYGFTAPPTPVRTLERAWRLGRQEGLEYVYIGNAPLHPYDNTYCPGCGFLLVERHGLRVTGNAVTGGRCPRCDREIPGVGWSWARRGRDP